MQVSIDREGYLVPTTSANAEYIKGFVVALLPDYVLVTQDPAPGQQRVLTKYLRRRGRVDAS